MVAALFLGVIATASGQSCPASYGYGTSKPLLLGGLYESNVCTSGCKSRNSDWGKECRFDPNQGQWGVCTWEQRQQSLPYLEAAGRGAALNMKPCDIWPYIRGRTLWIIGDSFAKDLYKSMQCFLMDFWPHTECKPHTDSYLVKVLYDIPVQSGQSKCIHMPGLTRICMVRTVLGQQYVSDKSIPYGGVLPYLQAKFAKPEDIFLINFGVWHRKQGEDGFRQYDKALKDLVRFYQKTKGRFPYLLFKETPADHKKDMERGTCVPYGGIMYDRWNGNLYAQPTARGVAVTSVLRGTRLNRIARDVLTNHVPFFGRTGYELSVALYNQHVGTRGVSELDCLHYCQPGLPQIWVWEVYDALRSGLGGVYALNGKDPNKRHTCVPHQENW